MSNEKKPWCYYCRTDSHHDALCWSTRPKHWKPGPEDYEARIAALEQRLAQCRSALERYAPDVLDELENTHD